MKETFRGTDAFWAVAAYRDRGITYPNINIEYSFPEWMAEKFVLEYGKEKACEMMRSGIGARPLYLRINRCRTDAPALLAALKNEGIRSVMEVSDPDTGEKLPYTLKVNAGELNPADSESFAKGLYSVQDLSSQLACYELWKQTYVYIKQKEIVDINVFDLCSAPGGKTCFFAEMMKAEPEDEAKKNCQVRAFDISDRKFEKIRENLERTGIRGVRPEIKDAAAFDPSLEKSADIIIADLPCSGLGVIGRKVDIKYRVGPGDIIELCNLQHKMIDNAVRYLKPSGILLYSVCTVTREETSEQAAYIEKHGLHKISERLFLQGVDPCDGFYYSVWQNKGH